MQIFMSQVIDLKMATIVKEIAEVPTDGFQVPRNGWSSPFPITPGFLKILNKENPIHFSSVLFVNF